MPDAVKVQKHKVPPELVKLFEREYRVIGHWPPAPGYWPIDLRVLVEGGLGRKLFENPEFEKQFQIVIMPR